jgi:hypothetical protein
LDYQKLVFIALSISIIVLASVLTMILLRLKKTIEFIERRADDAIRQFELTAEDLRKTLGTAHEVLAHAEKSVENVKYVTDGVRDFRKTFDAASKVLNYAVIPFLGTFSGGLAGAKAAVSSLANRFGRKER